MQMSYNEFANALRNNCLPEIHTQQNILYKNDLIVPMIRDVNDHYTNYSEWLYGRRENLRKFIEKDLFKLSPFSKENYAWVDEKLEQMYLDENTAEQEDEEGEVIEWENYVFTTDYNFDMYKNLDFYEDNDSDFDYYDRSLYCDSDDYWFR